MSSIADLIVILAEHHKMRSRKSARGIAMSSAAKLRILPVVIPSVAQHFAQVADAAKIGIIAAGFGREQRVDRMVKIIAPLRWNGIAALFARTQYPSVVKITFRNQIKRSSQLTAEKLNRAFKLGEKVICAEIEVTVNGVEPQCIDVEVFEPKERVFFEESANTTALSIVEIYCLAPGRAVLVGEIRSELAQVISFRADVVVHHVKTDREPVFMRVVYKSLQGDRATVSILNRKRVHPVVAPIARSRELRERH